MIILLTGASGFLGQHIVAELSRDHDLITLGRRPIPGRHVCCDLARHSPVLPDTPIDVVIHAAGKAHSIPRTTAERAEYDRINVEGTQRLLDALSQQSTPPGALVHISSVLVYGRQTGDWLTEETPVGAGDGYGPSKVRAEAVVRDWAARTGTRTAILRLPLVAASPPGGNLATMQRAIGRGLYARIGTGNARRSLVRADDVAAVLLRAAAAGGTYHLTDGHHPTVAELENALARQAGRTGIPAVPLALARVAARVGDGIGALTGRPFPVNTSVLQKLTSSLTFADDTARRQLHWRPRPVLDLFS